MVVQTGKPLTLQAKVTKLSVADLEPSGQSQYPITGDLSGEISLPSSELQPGRCHGSSGGDTSFRLERASDYELVEGDSFLPQARYRGRRTCTAPNLVQGDFAERSPVIGLLGFGQTFEIGYRELGNFRCKVSGLSV